MTSTIVFPNCRCCKRSSSSSSSKSSSSSSSGRICAECQDCVFIDGIASFFQGADCLSFPSVPRFAIGMWDPSDCTHYGRIYTLGGGSTLFEMHVYTSEEPPRLTFALGCRSLVAVYHKTSGPDGCLLGVYTFTSSNDETGETEWPGSIEIRSHTAENCIATPPETLTLSWDFGCMKPEYGPATSATLNLVAAPDDQRYDRNGCMKYGFWVGAVAFGGALIPNYAVGLTYLCGYTGVGFAAAVDGAGCSIGNVGGGVNGTVFPKGGGAIVGQLYLVTLSVPRCPFTCDPMTLNVSY